MAHDVFISHATKDKKLADAICAGLEARGIRCWIAPRDIVPGVNYAGQIFKAISTGKIFLIIITENSTLSTHVLKEVEIAIQSGSAVLPFRTQDVPLSDDLKYYLSNVHWLDALTPPVERHISHLGDFIFRLLGRPESKESSAAGSGSPGKSSSPEQVEPPAIAGAKPSQTSVRASQDIPVDDLPARPPDIKKTREQRKPSKKSKKIGQIIGVAIAGCALIATGVVGYLSGWFVPEITPTATPAQPLPTLASYDPIVTQVSGTDGMPMVFVPEGRFLMGSLEGMGNPSEYPQHPVYLRAYWIDQTEVTNEMYARCIGEGGCDEPPDAQLLELSDYPVVNVNIEQAKQYCEWAGKALPTEAQWEKAARGTDGRMYPWGNEFVCSNGNLDIPDCDEFEKTAPVGSFPAGASPYGALDMAGNVWEWVADWYGPYWPGVQTNPEGPGLGDKIIFRGGSWSSSEESARVAVRPGYYYGHYDDKTGFRCISYEDPEALELKVSIIDSWTDEVTGMTMVLVPSKEFLMGSPENEGANDEMPQHMVYLESFWIDQTEVTNRMYQLCEEAGFCTEPKNLGSPTREYYYHDERLDDYPVIYVTWEQANNYCLWSGKRLPTEAEWELAARGVDYQYYPWGYDEPDSSAKSLANFMGLLGDTTAVGSFPLGASPFGVLDMAGNVSEWVADWYGPYEEGYFENPIGPESGEERVTRGGSWRSEAGGLHTTLRIPLPPEYADYDVGFRCAGNP